MTEIWRDIVGFPTYQVSSYGRVRNLNTKNVLMGGDHNGRRRVNLHRRTRANIFYVHHLVAEAFLEDYTPRRRVLHYDEDPSNNRADNLYMGGASSQRLRKDILVEVIETGGRYASVSQAARSVGGQPGNVQKVLDGRLITHKGFTYRYVKA